MFDGGGNIVIQAVIGTFAAFAGTLAAYKFFDIKVGNKFRTFVIAAMFGMVGLGLLELVLEHLRHQHRPLRLRRARPAVRHRRPRARCLHADPRLRLRRAGRRRRPPRARVVARGVRLTVSLVWIYTNLLRILAIFQHGLISRSSTAARSSQLGRAVGMSGSALAAGAARPTGPVASGLLASTRLAATRRRWRAGAAVAQLDPAAAEAALRAADLGAVELGAGRTSGARPRRPRPGRMPSPRRGSGSASSSGRGRARPGRRGAARRRERW